MTILYFFTMFFFFVCVYRFNLCSLDCALKLQIMNSIGKPQLDTQDSPTVFANCFVLQNQMGWVSKLAKF